MHGGEVGGQLHAQECLKAPGYEHAAAGWDGARGRVELWQRTREVKKWMARRQSERTGCYRVTRI